MCADILNMTSRRKYTKELLEEAVTNSVSFAGVLRYLGIKQAGGTQNHLANMIRKFEIDYSHFTGKAHNRGNPAKNKLSADEILRLLPEGSHRVKAVQLRRALLELGIEEECNRCGQGKVWQGRAIQLEINHIDGNWLNSLPENVEFICPNCHSQESHSNLPHKYRNE